jgi:hypothetical protein
MRYQQRKKKKKGRKEGKYVFLGKSEESIKKKRIFQRS